MVDESYDQSKRWWTLVVLCLSLVIVVVGNTVLNVALPTLVRELHASNSALQWVVDAYGLIFAGLLLTAGAIGDRFGRKGALTAGMIIFGGASTVAAFSSSSGQLIALRAVMGIGEKHILVSRALTPGIFDCVDFVFGNRVGHRWFSREDLLKRRSMSTQLVLTPQQPSQGKIGNTLLRCSPSVRESDHVHE